MAYLGNVEVKVTTLEAAKAEAIRIAKEHNCYTYITAVFDIVYVEMYSNSLNVFAPSDAYSPPFERARKWYVTPTGKVKHFTEAQIIADQNATPQMD